MLFKLSNLNSNLALTLDYLNPALNNSAQMFSKETVVPIHTKTTLTYLTGIRFYSWLLRTKEHLHEYKYSAFLVYTRIMSKSM